MHSRPPSPGGRDSVTRVDDTRGGPGPGLPDPAGGALGEQGGAVRQEREAPRDSRGRGRWSAGRSPPAPVGAVQQRQGDRDGGDQGGPQRRALRRRRGTRAVEWSAAVCPPAPRRSPMMEGWPDPSLSASPSRPPAPSPRRRPRARRAAVRAVPARAVLPDPLRLLRLQHLHRPRRPAGAYADAAGGGPAGARRCPATSTCRCRPSSSAAGPRRCWRRGPGAGAARRRREFGLAPGAEVTTEANPDRSTPPARGPPRGRLHPGLARDAVGGPARARGAGPDAHTGAAAAGRPGGDAAGFEHVNLDLIYGTPGESDDDWRSSLDAVAEAGPTHVSAYALIVEDGTRAGPPGARGVCLGTRRRRPRRPVPVARLCWGAAAWVGTRSPNWGDQCRHNVVYWRGEVTGGASDPARTATSAGCAGGTAAPGDYAAALTEGRSPEAGHEILTADNRRVERVMLELRLREGLPLDVLRPEGRAAAAPRRGRAAGAYSGRAVLTLRGRLLADAVVRDLVD